MATDIIRSREDLAAENRLLRRELEELRRRVESSPALRLPSEAARSFGSENGLLLLDRGRRVLQANHMASVWLGWSRAELPGRPLAEVDAGPWGKGTLNLLLDVVDMEDGRYVSTEREFDLGGRRRTMTLKSRQVDGNYTIEIIDATAMNQVIALFEAVVGGKVYEELIARVRTGDPESLLKARRGRISILFADLRDFTGICLSRAPEEIKAMLDGFMTGTSAAIKAENGMVNKFLGDGVLAIFGAPRAEERHALLAMRAAVRILRGHRGLMEDWKAKGLPTPELGLGLASGEVVYGCLGSGKQLDYTAIGTPVNVASRLCGEAAGGEALLTTELYEDVKHEILKDTDFFRGIAIRQAGERELRHAGKVRTVRLQLVA